MTSTEEVISEWLVLDGQQRLTTLYQVLKSKGATITRLETDKDKTVKRYYYLDIKKCLNPEADRLEAIISVSEKKQLTANIGRDILLDLSTKEKEFENLMFPLNITFSPNDTDDWRYEMEEYYGNDREYSLLFRQKNPKNVISKRTFKKIRKELLEVMTNHVEISSSASKKFNNKINNLNSTDLATKKFSIF